MPLNESHTVMNTPKENINLWRYMDIPSFLSLISTESLTFVRSDIFDDKFEGTLPKPTEIALDLEWEFLINNKKIKKSEWMYQNKKRVYINCWCKENYEMVHMWKIYSKENGIAIETNYERLKESIETEEEVYPTEIKYLDFKNDYLDDQSNFLTVYTIKRKEYKSENEFRLIMSYPRIIHDRVTLEYSNSQRDISVIEEELYFPMPVIPCKINVAKLITKIHLSPYAPKWYYEIIVDVLAKYNLSEIKVLQSEL